MFAYKYYQQWKAFKQDWKSFNLDHLHKFKFFKKINDQNIKIDVFFSDHCFTKSVTEEEILVEWYTDKDFYPFSPKPRVFCFTRYNFSCNLKYIIKEELGSSIFFSEKTDYFKHSFGKGYDYYVYFNIKKTWPKSINLFVNSAYLREDNPERKSNKISFLNIVKNILKWKFPKKPNNT